MRFYKFIPLISKDTIQTIIETSRVEEVVGDFVTLKKRGANFLGLCPFHNEKTPSFTVSPAKGIYKCFGCGKAGGSINFIMEHEHYSYPEALKYLAKKYNVEIEEDEQTPEQIQAMNEKENLYAVTAFAQKYFTDQLLNSEEGKAIGLSYFKNRDFRENTIEKFELGYNPDSWDAFTKNALENGFKPEFLSASGITIDKNGKRFDRFKGRVIFPIHNLSGRVIGFGGRILKKDDKAAKYINSPESDIYNKSKSLYGIYFAKSAIINKDNCFLVEGYTDVISLHQAGFENVVASSGTSLTQDQIRLIRRYTPNITILYDGDEAGLKASFRGIDMILEQGMNVKIVMFPQGEDPDSFVRSHRSIEVEEYLEGNAKDFIRFKTGILLKETKDDPVKKAGLIKEIVQSISLIPDGITRSVYVKECSSMMDIGEQTLMNELNKRLREKFKKQNKISHAEPESPVFVEAPPDHKQIEVDFLNTEYQEKDIVRLLLNYGHEDLILDIKDEHGHPTTETVSVARFIVDDLNADEIKFNNKDYQFIYDEFNEMLGKDEIPEDKYFINHENPKISKAAIDLLATPYELSKNWEEVARVIVVTEKGKLLYAVENAVLSFKAKRIEEMVHQNQEKIKTMENDEDLLVLLNEIKNLKETSREINKLMGRVITR